MYLALWHRMVEVELFRALIHFNIRLYAYNPVRRTHLFLIPSYSVPIVQLAGGLLSGRYHISDLNKESAGRFWTIGGQMAKMCECHINCGQ